MAMQTLQQPGRTAQDRRLRAVIGSDALFCGAFGSAGVLLAGLLPDVLGFGTPALFVGSGIAVLLWAAWLVRIATRRPVRLMEAYVPLLGNTVWVVASGLALLGDWLSLTTPGIWTLGGVALIVAGFAVAIGLALRPSG